MAKTVDVSMRVLKLSKGCGATYDEEMR